MSAAGATPVPAFVKGRERTQEAIINAGAARTVSRFGIGTVEGFVRVEGKNGMPLAGLLVAQRDASETITTMMLNEAQVKARYYFSLVKAYLGYCTAR